MPRRGLQRRDGLSPLTPPGLKLLQVLQESGFLVFRQGGAERLSAMPDIAVSRLARVEHPHVRAASRKIALKPDLGRVEFAGASLEFSRTLVGMEQVIQRRHRTIVQIRAGRPDAVQGPCQILRGGSPDD